MSVLAPFRYLKSKYRQRSASRKGISSDENDIASPLVLKEPKEPGLYPVPIDQTGNQTEAQPCEVDIVAVHGLDGTAYGSWTHKDGTFWLRDFLPKDLPRARVLTYKYPSQLLWSRSKATVTDYAQSLLSNLLAMRDEKRRPIIFVAHNLGGIVCKEALIKADQDPHFKMLLETTIGIIFFGTPHTGAETKNGVFLGKIFNVSGAARFTGGARTDLLEILKTNSLKLREIAQAFRHICGRFQIVSVYETEVHALLGRLIVDESSAQLSIANEHPIPGYGSHTDICRFGGSLGPDSPAYRLVLKELKDMCEKEFSLTESEKAHYEKFNDPAVDEYISTISQPVGGTCEWILKDPVYEIWALEPRTSLIWITGHAGCGKSALAKYITEQLEEERLLRRKDALICSFFCNNDIRAMSDAKAVLRRIIFQILHRHGKFVRHVMSAFDGDPDGHRLFDNYDRLWAIFMNIVSDPLLGPIDVVIDALDECEEKSRDQFMKGLAKLMNNSGSMAHRSIRLLLTFRPVVNINQSIRPYSELNKYFARHEPRCIALENKDHELDVDLRLVIGERVKGLANRIHAADIDELERFLYEHADRTFLWVMLALEMLHRNLRTAPGDFHRVLAGLPRHLVPMYHRSFEQVEEDDIEFARNLLYIIIASTRPLTLQEVNVIMSLQAKRKDCHTLAYLEKHYYKNIEDDMKRVLGSLIKISTSKVYLVHLSLKEYLCSTDKQGSQLEAVDLRQAHLFLASACVSYLSLNDFPRDLYSEAQSCDSEPSSASSPSFSTDVDEDFQAEAQQSDEESVDGVIPRKFIDHQPLPQLFAEIDADKRDKVSQNYPFFEYAAISWARHFAQCQEIADDNTKSLAIHLSDIRPHKQNSHWVRFFLHTIYIFREVPPCFDKVVIAAYFDHFTLLNTLLEHSDSFKLLSLTIALHWACHEGNERCVRRLLQTHVDPDQGKVGQQTFLCRATIKNSIGVVRILSQDPRVDINVRDSSSFTPLMWACGWGFNEIVEILLSQPRIEPDAEEKDGTTALVHSVLGNQIQTARMLIETGRVDVNHADDLGMTPLSVAIGEGNHDMVAFLLRAPHINARYRSSDGRTPLAEAAMRGHCGMIELLKEYRKLDRSHPHTDNNGRTAISLAAGGGFDEMIRLLLKYKFPGVDVEDKEKWTPLFWALKSEREPSTTVRILLESKLVNVNHTDRSGRTALSWAVSYEDQASLRLILAAEGIDPLIKNDEGLAPLDWARKLEDRSNIVDILESFLQSRD